MPSPLPPPIGVDLAEWGRQLSQYLQSNLSKISFKGSSDNPSEDGVFLWDESKKYAVVSLDGSFRQLATQQSVPASNVGSAGDVSGMISWDTNYIYICTASHDGSTAIWKRVALSSW